MKIFAGNRRWLFGIGGLIVLNLLLAWGLLISPVGRALAWLPPEAPLDMCRTPQPQTHPET